MTERCKAAECQVVGPVEAAILGRMFHSIGPVALALDVVGDLTPSTHVLLLWFLVLHDLIVHAIEFNGFIFFLLLCLMQQVVEFTITSCRLRTILMTVEKIGRLLLLCGVVHCLLRTNIEIGATRRTVDIHVPLLVHLRIKLADRF